MINSNLLRFMRKRGVFSKRCLADTAQNATYYVVLDCIMLFMLLMAIFSFCDISHAQGHLEPITVNYDDMAIKAIIGEAKNQGYEGMLAVACAIRNRGNLHGVYGFKAKRVIEHKYSDRTYRLASKAWIDSENTDIVNGATGWGNEEDIDIFKVHTWWSKEKIVAHIGKHWFYKCN